MQNAFTPSLNLQKSPLIVTPTQSPKAHLNLISSLFLSIISKQVVCYSYLSSKADTRSMQILFSIREPVKLENQLSAPKIQ
jgi:hypothetical protein